MVYCGRVNRLLAVMDRSKFMEVKEIANKAGLSYQRAGYLLRTSAGVIMKRDFDKKRNRMVKTYKLI